MRLFQEMVRQHPSLAQRLLGANEDRVQAMIDALTARMGVDPACDPYPAVYRWLQAVEASSQADDLPVDNFIDQAFDLLERGL